MIGALPHREEPQIVLITQQGAFSLITELQKTMLTHWYVHSVKLINHANAKIDSELINIAKHFF